MDEGERALLARIDERLAGHVEGTKTWQDRTSVKLHAIEDNMHKDNVRLDRIEQRERGRAKLLWVAVAAAMTSAAGWMRQLWVR